MQNFEYYTPTRVVFGQGAEDKVGELVRQQGAKKVLVHFGGGSAQKSGLLDRVYTALDAAGIPYVSLGGVVPNPHLALVEEGVALCRAEGVDFLLAVGGGSVIDSAKAIGYGLYGGGDVWKYFTGEEKPTGMTPVGAVLTLAAAGSEMSNASVITNEANQEKRGMSSPYGRCVFAVMNPALTLTLPAYQTAAGCVDIMMHTMERYFTKSTTMEVTDGIAETLLRTVMKNARILARHPNSYAARAEIMWAGSLSHNGLTGAGGDDGDWATHQLGQAMSALYDTTHGASLAAVWGSWARAVYKEIPARFARFAVEVMEVQEQGDDEELALAGIEELEGFFWSIDMPTSLAEAGIEADGAVVKALAENCSFHGTRTIGSVKKLDQDAIEAIYRAAVGDEE